MSDGVQHDLHGFLVSILVLAALCLSNYLSAWPTYPEVAAAAVGVLVGSWFLSPDLDMWKSRPVNRWLLLKYLWLPYTYCSNHRGMSHDWILGPAIRLIYIGVPAGLIWYHFYDLRGLGPWLLWAIAGIVVGNWVHLLADGRLPFRKNIF